MDYQLVFSPDLGLDPETFVDDWNADADCRAVARGRLEDALPQGFDFGLTGAVLIGVASSLAASALYDLIGRKKSASTSAPTWTGVHLPAG